MSGAREASGRILLVIAAGVLVLGLCAAAYVLLPQFVLGSASGQTVLGSHADMPDHVSAAKRLTVLLALLLSATLLILLFVIGAYLVIRIGRLVARTRSPVGGKPTEYVDAWQNYRLTDEDVSAATDESPPDEGPAGPDRDDRGP